MFAEGQAVPASYKTPVMLLYYDYLAYKTEKPDILLTQ